jgi:hypothetical protein
MFWRRSARVSNDLAVAVGGTLAGRADPGEDRMVAGDIEATLLRGDVTGDQRHGNIDIQKHTTLQAVDMIVTLYATVIAAGLVRERQLLNQAMLGQKVERAIDGAVANPRVAPPDAFKNLASGQVALGEANLFEHRGTLNCVLEALTWHDFSPRS